MTLSINHTFHFFFMANFLNDFSFTQIRLLLSCNGGAEDVKPGTGNNMLKAGAASFM